MSSIASRIAQVVLGLVAVASATIGFAAAPAFAAEAAVTSYTAKGSLAPDGALSVKATLVLEGSPSSVQQRFATTMASGRDGQYRFALSNIAAQVGGQPVTPQVTTDGDYQVVTVPTQAATGPVVIDYTVTGAALNAGTDSNGEGVTELNWRLLQGLNLPVRTFDATITPPGLFTSIDCYAGPPASPGNCGYYAGGTHDAPDPTFHDEGLGAGEVVGAVLRFNSAVVAPNSRLEQLWSLDHAFSFAPLPLGLAVGIGLLGGAVYWLLHRRYGRDAVAAATPTVIGSFKPVGAGQSEFELSDDIRPGEIGTLADERVDPIDVTASVLDLAVRNHLRITELPTESRFGLTDWLLERTESAVALLPYERTLLDAIAPAAGGKRLGEVGAALTAALPAIQAELYDEVVRKGWFSARPDQTRIRWARMGWLAIIVGLVAAGLLIAFTQFGLLGLVLLALGAGVGPLGQVMPARTQKGAAALAGMGVLRGLLLTHPTDEMPKGREMQELASVLPYTVVLGGAERWLTGIVAADDKGVDDATELSWYHAPEGWQLTDLPNSLRNFVRAFQGTLVSRS